MPRKPKQKRPTGRRPGKSADKTHPKKRQSAVNAAGKRQSATSKKRQSAANAADKQQSVTKQVKAPPIKRQSAADKQQASSKLFSEPSGASKEVTLKKSNIEVSIVKSNKLPLIPIEFDDFYSPESDFVLHEIYFSLNEVRTYKEKDNLARIAYLDFMKTMYGILFENQPFPKTFVANYKRHQDEKYLKQIKPAIENEQKSSINGVLTSPWTTFAQMYDYYAEIYYRKEFVAWLYVVMRAELRKVNPEISRAAISFIHSVLDYEMRRGDDLFDVPATCLALMQNDIDKKRTGAQVFELQDPFKSLTIIPKNNQRYTATLLFPDTDNVEFSGHEQATITQYATSRQIAKGKYMDQYDFDVLIKSYILKDENENIIAHNPNKKYFGNIKPYYLVISGDATFTTTPFVISAK